MTDDGVTGGGMTGGGVPAGGEVPRRGLVLGGGGMLGAAWTVGVLRRLEDELSTDLTKVEVIVGTSAGSVIGTLLAAGVTPRQMVAHQRGEPVTAGPLAGVGFDYGITASRPQSPERAIGSPDLLRRIVRRPRDYRLPALVAALLPRGRGGMGALPELLDRILPAWPTTPALRICAMDFASGQRRVLDAADGPGVSPARAVAASCAVPGWFGPVRIDGRLLVDGGSYSFSSVDVAADDGLDEVIVIAPLAHQARAVPGSFTNAVGQRMLRWWRVPQTRRMYTEAEALRRNGTMVRVIAPTRQEMTVLGLNPMDPRRRLEVLTAALRGTEPSGAGNREADHREEGR